MSIKEYFANYDNLSYEEWCEMLPDILEETTTYKELAQTVKGMYEEMMVPLKRRQDDAKIIMTEFTDLQREYEKQKEELEATAETKKGWAIGLAFVPFINVIATPLLASVLQTTIWQKQLPRKPNKKSKKLQPSLLKAP
jgi:hypothetical protein